MPDEISGFLPAEPVGTKPAAVRQTAASPSTPERDIGKKCACPDQHDDRKVGKPSARAHWTQTHGSFWSQITLIVIGSIALLIYFCQLQATQKALMVDQRAWVGPKTFVILNLPLEANKPIEVETDYWNFGKTPALHVSGFAQPDLVVSTAKLNFSKWGEPLESDRSVLFPGASNHILRKFYAIPEPVFSDLLKEKSFLYIYGNIGYDDVFGFHHWTHFCLRYSIPDAGFVYCETFNDVDRNQE
jgi:hypothetical protein